MVVSKTSFNTIVRRQIRIVVIVKNNDNDNHSNNNDNDNHNDNNDNHNDNDDNDNNNSK